MIRFALFGESTQLGRPVKVDDILARYHLEDLRHENC